MSEKRLYEWHYQNGKAYKSEDCGLIRLEGKLIYEVIRIIDSVPLFYEAHLERLLTSAKLVGMDCEASRHLIKQDVAALIAKEALSCDNLRLVVGEVNGEITWDIFGVNGFYPPSEWYETGVRTKTIMAERHDPHAKVVNASLTLEVDKLRNETGVFEALLVNQMGLLTEGSRSNLFLIREDKVISPKASLALKGITRQKLLEVIEEQNIPYEEQDVSLSDLETMEGIFISGTSIDLLPVSAVDELAFNSSKLPLMRVLLEGYREKMKQSLAQF